METQDQSELYDTSTYPTSTSPFFAGTVSGLVAGILMGLFTMLVASLSDDGLWAPLRTITALFFGEEYAGPTFAVGSVLGGMLIHLALSIIFALIFVMILGMFSNRAPMIVQLILGFIFGIILWLINTFVIGPFLPGGDDLIDQVMLTTIPSWAWGAGHIVYGLALAWLYARWRVGDTTIAR